MPSSLIAPVVGAGISFGANKLFGSKNKGATSAAFNPAMAGSAVADTSALSGFQVPGFSGGGLTGTFDGNSFGVTSNAARNAAVGGLASTFGTQAGQIAGLRSTVAPGFSALRKAALGQIENARQNAIGNLRENLQRRRVLGSSFAQDAASRTEAEFAQQKAVTEAQSYLQELEATNQLMQHEFTARRGQFQTGIDEMNLEANLAAGISGKATEILGKNAQMEAMLATQTAQTNAQLATQAAVANTQTGALVSKFNAEQAAKAAEGEGKFIGQLTQPIADAAGKGAGKFFAGKNIVDLMPTSI